VPSWLLGSLRGYRPAWLRGDVLPGLTVWAVLVPESLAYATIAGVPPVVGLYAGSTGGPTGTAPDRPGPFSRRRSTR
jgi:MFS superfamily sulfate permease-like transporter